MTKMGYEGRTVHYDWHNQRPEKYGYKFKSKAERMWADYLEFLKELGAIEEWEYEPETFQCGTKYRKERIYTPDFRVMENYKGHTTTVYHEVKTSLRQKDISRFKWLKEFHVVIIVLVLPNRPKRSVKQIDLLAKARKYVDRVVFANPLYRKHGIK